MFKQKFGTPRQSLFSNLARSKLRIRTKEGESWGRGYYWIIFVFHKDFKGQNKIYSSSENSEISVKKGKIKPPKLFGDTMGVFATRSPHRYNPLGISIGKVYKTKTEGEYTTLYFSGLDLVHETPILSIIPYTEDHITKDLKIPSWLSETQKEQLLKINFSPDSLENIENLLSEGIIEFYENCEDLCEFIQSVLSLNPHSTHVLKHHSTAQLYGIELDNLNVIYKMDSKKEEITIEKILDIQKSQDYYGHIKQK